ncbi:hypothetical protein L2E82_48514 [Cichorium intybus]|uniref:Uncharacterized protein n=1 Tax=Cichorium intybus TaxID=13427 RepID=A0ACB8YXI9_CICIN|nr:hypothetical protein L2E82_48514 [Cichorium intybus]
MVHISDQFWDCISLRHNWGCGKMAFDDLIVVIIRMIDNMAVVKQIGLLPVITILAFLVMSIGFGWCFSLLIMKPLMELLCLTMTAIGFIKDYYRGFNNRGNHVTGGLTS